MKNTLKSILFLSLIFSLPFNKLAAQSYSNHIKPVDMSTMKKTHPRVLVNDFETIKKNLKANAVMQGWLRELNKETTLDALALSYALTGDKQKMEQAVNTTFAMDWDKYLVAGGHHYGPMTMRLGCVYDWLHDSMNSEQREKMQQLLKKMLEAYLKDPNKTNYHNFNHVLNAGAIVGSVAIADEEPELAKKVFNVAINALNLSWYKPDGVTPEGPHYMVWSNLVMMSGLATLDAAFGESFGLSDEPGLMGYGDFVMNSTVPRKGLAVKYGDCYSNGSFYTVGQIYWLAGKFNRPDLSQFALEYDPFVGRGENPDYSGYVNNLLWYNPIKFKSDPNNFKTLPLEKQFKSAQLAVMRSGWNEDNLFFAGIKGTDDYRQANYFHRHTNTGTFFLSALGEQWCLDLGLEDYGIKEYNVQPRLYYKLRAEGHNCNIINPASGIDNLGWEKCPIIRQAANLKESFAIIDMTPDYANIAKSAKRGLKMFDNRRKVMIQDEISTLDGKPLDSYWFMQTEAGIEIAPNGRSAMLYRGNEKMLVYMATAPKDARFTVMSTDPLIYSRPVASKQNWTFAAKKLTIHTNSETDLKLSVVFVPIHKGEGNVVPTEIPFQALDNWTVASEKEALLSSLKIDNKSLANFDKRNFTYDIDLKDAKVPLIKAISENKASKIAILQATSIPGKAEISVSADGMQPTTYCVYFREKTPQIISSTAKEYSSWDESFADHRISARPISAGKYLEYDLGETSKVGALTIGVRQQMKSYKFELLASDDMESWNSVYVGQTKVVDGLKVAMPQAFSFPVFKTRYIRVKCPENSSTFTVDIIRFHKDEADANTYISKAYRETLSDVTINQGEINLKSGAKIKLKLEGISNYKRLVDLADATIRFESEKPQVATVSSTGEILAIEDGEARIRIVIQKGDVVIHKKILVKVQNNNAIKCLASCTVNLRSNQPNKNFINDKDITIDNTNVSLLRFNLKDLDGKSFSKAVIRLYAANTSFEPIENKLYLTTNDWSQSTVNFANKPVQGELITTFKAPTNITDYVDVDITSIIKEKLKADSEISLILGANSKISYSGVSEKDLKPLLIVF